MKYFLLLSLFFLMNGALGFGGIGTFPTKLTECHIPSQGQRPVLRIYVSDEFKIVALQEVTYLPFSKKQILGNYLDVESKVISKENGYQEVDVYRNSKGDFTELNIKIKGSKEGLITNGTLSYMNKEEGLIDQKSLFCSGF